MVIARGQRDAALLAALRNLPLELQLVLELHYWEGMSTAELAEVLELAQGTVKTRLFRARAQLRERMGADPSPEVEATDDFDAWAQSLRGLVSGAIDQ